MMIMVIIVVWGLGPIGLGWVSYLVRWVGFGSMKWTHGQLWSARKRWTGTYCRREWGPEHLTALQAENRPLLRYFLVRFMNNV